MDKQQEFRNKITRIHQKYVDSINENAQSNVDSAVEMIKGIVLQETELGHTQIEVGSNIFAERKVSSQIYDLLEIYETEIAYELTSYEIDFRIQPALSSGMARLAHISW